MREPAFAWFDDPGLLQVDFGEPLDTRIEVLLVDLVTGARILLDRVPPGSPGTLVAVPRWGELGIELRSEGRSRDYRFAVGVDAGEGTRQTTLSRWVGRVPEAEPPVEPGGATPGLPPAKYWREQVECGILEGVQGPCRLAWIPPEDGSIEVRFAMEAAGQGAVRLVVTARLPPGKPVPPDLGIEIEDYQLSSRRFLRFTGWEGGQARLELPDAKTRDRVRVFTGAAAAVAIALDPEGGPLRLRHPGVELRRGRLVPVEEPGRAPPETLPDWVLSAGVSPGPVLAEVVRRRPGLVRELLARGWTDHLETPVIERIHGLPNRVLAAYLECTAGEDREALARRTGGDERPGALLERFLVRPGLFAARRRDPRLDRLLDAGLQPGPHAVVEVVTLLARRAEAQPGLELWLEQRGEAEVALWIEAVERGLEPGAVARVRYQLGIDAGAGELEEAVAALDLVSDPRVVALGDRVHADSGLAGRIAEATRVAGLSLVPGREGWATLRAARDAVLSVVDELADELAAAVARRGGEPPWDGLAVLAAALRNDPREGLAALETAERQVRSRGGDASGHGDGPLVLEALFASMLAHSAWQDRMDRLVSLRERLCGAGAAADGLADLAWLPDLPEPAASCARLAAMTRDPARLGADPAALDRCLAEAEGLARDLECRGLTRADVRDQITGEFLARVEGAARDPTTRLPLALLPDRRAERSPGAAGAWVRSVMTALGDVPGTRIIALSQSDRCALTELLVRHRLDPASYPGRDAA